MRKRTPALLFLALAAALPLTASALEAEPRLLDRDLLTETLTLDEQEPLADAEAELEATQAELEAAEAARDAAALAVETATTGVSDAEAVRMQAEDALAADPGNPDLQAAVDLAEEDLLAAQTAPGLAAQDLAAKEVVVTEKQTLVEERSAAVQTILDEIALTGGLVAQLSDKQVQALNSALHSSYKTGLLPFDIDSEWLQRIIDEELRVGPIHHLVRAYAQEARFLRLAARFDEKALDSGNERFSERAEAAREKGAAEFEKFVEKVDAASARADAKEAAQEERRAASRGKAHSK